MKALRVLMVAVLLACAQAAVAEEKRIDVDSVDVPERIVVQPTPEEIHTDAPPEQKCSSCHGPSGLGAEVKPLDHFLTTRDCGVCHFNKSWIPLRIYNHMSARYRPRPGGDPTDCKECHVSNTEFQAR